MKREEERRQSDLGRIGVRFTDLALTRILDAGRRVCVALRYLEKTTAPNMPDLLRWQVTARDYTAGTKYRTKV